MTFCFVVFGCYFLQACSVLMRYRRDLERRGKEEELGGAEGGKTEIRLYCMRK